MPSIEVKPYGDGLMPVRPTDCPLFKKYGENSCVGRSGENFCGGYLGEHSGDDKRYVECGERASGIVEVSFITESIQIAPVLLAERLAPATERWFGILIHDDACFQGPFTIKVTCPTTGQSADYTTLPTHDVPCPCGNPNHWFVKYETRKETP